MAVPPGSTTSGKSSKTTAKLYKIFTAVSKKKPFSANSHTKTTRSKHRACSRRSDSSPPLVLPPFSWCTLFNSLPTDRCALLSERLEQAKLIHHISDSRMRGKALRESMIMDFFWKNPDLDAKRLESNRQVSHETTNFTARYQQGKQRNKS